MIVTSVTEQLKVISISYVLTGTTLVKLTEKISSATLFREVNLKI